MKQLIVTADDYGVFPAINEAILDCVKEKKINSVAVLPNYEGSIKYSSSIQNLEKLLNLSNGNVDIGCHLTITSGKPVTGDRMAFACDNDGNFKSFTSMRNYSSPAELAAIEEELCEQVVRIRGFAGDNFRHLTNHHNSLTLFERHFKIYLNVAKKFRVPIRSAYVRPEGKQNFYIFYLGLALDKELTGEETREMKDFQGRIVSYFNSNCEHVKAPQILDSCHYGPLSTLPYMHLLSYPLVLGKRSRLNKAYETFASDLRTSAEIVLHLAKPTGLRIDRSKDLDYTGIDRSYFDSRCLEYKSVMGYDFEKWNGVELAGWGRL